MLDLVAENLLLAGGQLEPQAAFWSQHLGGEFARTAFPGDSPERLGPSIFQTLRFQLPPELAAEFRRIAKGSPQGLFLLELALVAALQHRFIDQDQLGLGIPLLRDTPTPHCNELVPLLLDAAASPSFRDWLGQIKAAVTALLPHQNYPLHRLFADWKIIERDQHQRPGALYELVVAHEELHIEEQVLRAGQSWRFFGPATGQGPLGLQICFDTTLFRTHSIEALWSHFLTLARDALRDPGRPLGELRLFEPGADQDLLARFNRTEADFPLQYCLHHFLADQARRNPRAIALRHSFDGKPATLDYGQLDARANRLARRLRALGVGPDTVVALILRRSPELMIALFAIHKAGGAYLPIDPEFPPERIAFMLADGQPLAVITSKQHHVPETTAHILRVEDLLLHQDGPPESTAPLDELALPHHLAYLLYTSGSTGQPKGTMIEHRAAVNRIHWMQRQYQLQPQDVILQKTPITFDVSVWELFWWSFVGASLALLEPGGEKDPETLVAAIERHQVDTLHFVPSMLAAFLGYLDSRRGERQRVSSLRRVYASGEALAVSQVALFNQLLGTPEPGSPSAVAQLHNLYGPTEATVDVSYFPCQGADNLPRIPIGKPIDNIRLYVLDRAGRLQPPLALGELHIGGIGLARGYLNRSELNASKFVAHPLEPGQRLYKTGDLSRWLPDGNIEFFGRLDFQVKIRGYRIELGEIENQLLAHPAVAEAAVIDRQDPSGQKYLAAYVVTRGPFEPDGLRQFLASRLASYMIPAFFVQLSAIPLTPSGKLNRRLLPEPQRGSHSPVSPPIGPVETLLAEIWTRILDVEPIGRESHFFELGGNSLKAAILINHIHKRLGVSPAIKSIFAHPSLAALAAQLEQLQPSHATHIPLSHSQNHLAAPAQKRLFVLDRLEGATIRYNMPAAFRVRGQFQPDRLRHAFHQLARRHQLLTAAFDFLEDGQVQLLLRPDALPALEQGQISEAELEITAKNFVRPFDLRQAPLLRIGLFQIHEGGQLLLIDLHHILADGASIPILLAEFQTLYLDKQLEPLPIQYQDYVAWLLEQRETPDYHRQREYWARRFANPPQPLQLHTDFPRPSLQSLAGDSLVVRLPRQLGDQLVALAAQRDTTLFTLLLAAFQLLLSRYSGQDDIVVGTPVAGRRHHDALALIGMFVNTLALRARISPEQPFSEFLADVRADLLEALENQDFPFEELVDFLKLQRDMGRNPLFDTLFVYQESAIGEQQLGDIRLQPLRFPLRIAKFDLLLSADRTRDGIQLEWEYCSELFQPDTIRALSGHFQNLLQAIVDTPSAPLAQLDLLSPAERHHVLEALNAESFGDRDRIQDRVEWPQQDTLVSLFENAAHQFGERTALSFHQSALTYRQLNQHANRLAHRLIREGVDQDQIVGVLLERQLQLPTALLAVLKAGGAYLPLEPQHPAERLHFMLQDSQVRVLLTTHDLLPVATAAAEGLPITLIPIDIPDHQDLPLTNPQPRALPGSLAYIIYTSGTTGRPKGVMIEHRNVTRLLFNSRNPFHFRPDDVWTLFHSYAFDFSVWELFGALLYGGRLVIVPKDVAKEPAAFLQLLAHERVTVLNQTPSAFQNLVLEEAGHPIGLLTHLRYIIFGGEALKPSSLQGFHQRYPQTALINMYGITETTVHVTFRHLLSPDLERATSLIGRAIPTLRLYVCDRRLQPLPVGVPGELCVSGEGLARGYRNRPELTSERFVMSPFHQGERLYRSGDLARWLPSGELEYLGRIDQQVKIRGHRIELGEIEQRLLAHPALASAAVLARPDTSGALQLVAYLIAKSEPDPLQPTLNSANLRAYLAISLPDYMLPSHFILLDHFPLTINGKVDLHALPQPSQALRGSADHQGPPLDPLESLLAQIWSQILGIPDIGRDDNFFALGGDSIKAIQVSARLRSRRLALRVQDLFQNPTIAQARTRLKPLSKEIEQTPLLGEIPLTPIQLWFFQHHRNQPAWYNQALMLFRRQGFDPERVLLLWRRLCRHHDILRARFQLRDPLAQNHDETSDQASSPQWTAKILPPEAEVLRYEAHDLRGYSRNQALAQLQPLVQRIQSGTHPVSGAPLSLAEGPLLRLGLFHLEEGDHLLIVIHHLLTDGVSWRILLEDFAKGLEAQEPDQQGWLQPKTHSYKDWALALKQKPQTWIPTLPSTAASAQQAQRPTGPSIQPQTQSIQLSAAVTHQLQKEANAAYHTEMNDLLLAALALSWHHWTGQPELTVRLEGHGREPFDELDVSRTVGWFTSMFPVRLELKRPADLAYCIKSIKEALRQIPEKGFGYLPYLYYGSEGARQPQDHPTIGFNYLGELDAGQTGTAFKLSDIPTGQAQAPNTELALDLDLNSSILDGRLRIELSYNPERYRADQVQTYLAAYQSDLERILAHCTQKQAPELTPSDLTAKGLDLDDLDDLFAALES